MNKSNNITDLIEISDEDYNKSYSQSSVSTDDNCNNNTDNDSDDDNDDDSDNNDEIIFIHKDNIHIDDKKIMNFIKFCINKKIFDDTFYDYTNGFSIVATKLPIVFKKLTNDGKNIKKQTFINVFKNKYNYVGDIEYIYNYIDEKKKGHINWEQFFDFFLPFVKYITY